MDSVNAHPIPQNVTSFEFHLVGDMTLKQFGYLAGGLGLAYAVFIFIYPLSIPLSIPLMIIFSALGVAFAFLPLYDRPLDHWVRAYLKAIFSPTTRSWVNPKTKQAVEPLKDPLFLTRLNVYLPPKQPLIVSGALVQSLRPSQPVMKPNFTPQYTNQRVQPQTTNLPTDEQLKQTVEVAKQSQTIQNQILEAEKRMDQLKQVALNQAVDPQVKAVEMQQVFNNLQGLIKQAQGLSIQLSQTNNQHPPSITPPIIAKPAEVKVVEPEKPKDTQLQLTSLPNVINGIVTDSKGNYLEAVVVVIHNKDNLPVRASKTNKLGQFAGATPLQNGTYTVTLEKDGLEFDTLEIELTGELLAPLKIQAKEGG